MTRQPFLRPLLAWGLAGAGLVLAVALWFPLLPLLGRRRAFWLLAPRYVRAAAAAFGLRRELEGWEALPDGIRTGSQPAVFVGNHTSLFDPMLVISQLPIRPVLMAKAELARVPVLGWAIRQAGFIFVDRRSRTGALRSLREAARQVQAGQSLVVFPEGTRSRDGVLLPFKKGAFLVAWEAGVPLVPFAIHGGRSALPWGAWRVRPGRLRTVVGAPLDPAAFSSPEALRAAAAAAVERLSSRP